MHHWRDNPSDHLCARIAISHQASLLNVVELQTACRILIDTTPISSTIDLSHLRFNSRGMLHRRQARPAQQLNFEIALRGTATKGKN